MQGISSQAGNQYTNHPPTPNLPPTHTAHSHTPLTPHYAYCVLHLKTLNPQQRRSFLPNESPTQMLLILHAHSCCADPPTHTLWAVPPPPSSDEGRASSSSPSSWCLDECAVCPPVGHVQPGNDAGLLNLVQAVRYGIKVRPHVGVLQASGIRHQASARDPSRHQASVSSQA